MHERRKITFRFIYHSLFLLDPDQYTVIPLTAKIIKLLVAEASTSTTVEQINENDADSINEEVKLRITKLIFNHTNGLY
jgi:hypothetical protein